MIARVLADGSYVPLVTDPDDFDPKACVGNRVFYAHRNRKVKLEEPGEYIIRSKVKWKNGLDQTYTLSVYSDQKIELIRVPKIKDFLTKYLTYIGHHREDRRDLGYDTSMLEDYFGHLYYRYVENNGTRTLHFELAWTNCENIKPSSRMFRNGKAEMTVKPGERAVCLGKKIKMNGDCYLHSVFRHSFQ